MLLALATTLLFPTPSQSNTNDFGAGEVFELNLSDSEIAFIPKKEREQKLLEQFKKRKVLENHLKS